MQSVDERERALALVRDGMVKLMELREEEIEHLAVKAGLLRLIPKLKFDNTHITTDFF